MATTDNKRNANMEVKIVTTLGVDVPVLYNPKEIAALTKLVKYKPAKVAQAPLQNAEVVGDSEDIAKSRKAKEPAAKRRKST